MELLQLAYFYKIAHTPTLTQAAAELHISQPALSKLIRGLEDEFHIKFFDRRGRYIRLNENGEIFLKYATRILNTVEDMRSELQDFRMREDLSLRVGVFAGSTLFPDIISGFRKEHPNIKVTVVQHSFENSPGQNSLDLILQASSHMPSYPDCIRLMEEEILLAVPNTHPLRLRDSVTLTELKEENFISLSAKKGLRIMMDEYCAEVGFQPNIVLESDDPAMMRNLIQSGFGLSFVPEKSWTAYIQGDVHLLHITDPKCIRYIYLITPRGVYRSIAARLFQQYLIRFFENASHKTRQTL